MLLYVNGSFVAVNVVATSVTYGPTFWPDFMTFPKKQVDRYNLTRSAPHHIFSQAYLILVGPSEVLQSWDHHTLRHCAMFIDVSLFWTLKKHRNHHLNFIRKDEMSGCLSVNIQLKNDSAYLF